MFLLVNSLVSGEADQSALIKNPHQALSRVTRDWLVKDGHHMIFHPLFIPHHCVCECMWSALGSMCVRQVPKYPWNPWPPWCCSNNPNYEGVKNFTIVTRWMRLKSYDVRLNQPSVLLQVFILNGTAMVAILWHFQISAMWNGQHCWQDVQVADWPKLSGI